MTLTPHPTFPRLSDSHRSSKKPCGKVGWGGNKDFYFPWSCTAFTSRIPADNDLQLDNDTVTRWNERLCSPRSLRLLGTQAAHAAPRPELPDQRRTPLAPSASLVAVWKHFLPPPPSPASRWERVGLSAGSALAVTPTRFPDSPRRGGPRLAPRSHGGTQAPGAERGRSGTPRFGQGKGQLAARRDPVAFPGVTCSLAGVSRSSRPLPALSPHAVAHAGFSAGPPCTRGGGRPAAPRCCPEPRRPRVNGSRSPTSELLNVPWGALCPTPASPQTLRARGEGGGQAKGARDSARPETSPAGGAEGGGGHRRSYSRITRRSQLGPAPRSLSLTCLTPPRPGPAPFLPLGVPAPRSPAAPGAHVTDGTAPRAGPGFLIGFSQGAYRPSAPPSQVPALSSVSRGERPGIMRPQPPRLCAGQSLPLPEPRPGPGPALWGGAVRSLKGPPGPEPAST